MHKFHFIKFTSYFWKFFLPEIKYVTLSAEIYHQFSIDVPHFFTHYPQQVAIPTFGGYNDYFRDCLRMRVGANVLVRIGITKDCPPPFAKLISFIVWKYPWNRRLRLRLFEGFFLKSTPFLHKKNNLRKKIFATHSWNMASLILNSLLQAFRYPYGKSSGNLHTT